MFYRNIFFVKQKTIFFPTFIEMHIYHIFVNNLKTSPQERICHISLFVKHRVPRCLGMTLLSQFKFHSITMLSLDFVTLRYQNATRVKKKVRRYTQLSKLIVLGKHNSDKDF